MKETPLIEISPITEVVSGHTNKLQVNLPEDAPDKEILHALDEACREWSANLVTGIELQRVVGRILIAVRDRGIYKAEPWGSFDAFLEKEVSERFHISPRHARNAITVAEGIPEDVPVRRLRAAGATNVLQIARAVRDADKDKRERLRESLLDKASKMSTSDFSEELKRRKLVRTSNRGPRLVTISFQVSVETAAIWRSILGEGAASVLFSQWVREHQKQPRKMGVQSTALRHMRESRPA